MKLKEFLLNIKDMVDKNPELLETEVVYSADDEGNNFDVVTFSAVVGHYEDNQFKETENINSICIN